LLLHSCLHSLFPRIQLPTLLRLPLILCSLPPPPPPQDPHSPSLFHRAHARIEALSVVANVLLVVLGILLRKYPVLYALVYWFVQTTILLAWLVLQPIYSRVMQDIQVGLAAIPCWTGLCFLILVGGGVPSGGRMHGVSVLLFAGMLPCAIGAGALSGMVRKKVARRARQLLSGTSDDAEAHNRAMESYDANAALSVKETIGVSGEGRQRGGEGGGVWRRRELHW
jgi:hypothetical protein